MQEYIQQRVLMYELLDRLLSVPQKRKKRRLKAGEREFIARIDFLKIKSHIKLLATRKIQTHYNVNSDSWMRFFIRFPEGY